MRQVHAHPAAAEPLRPAAEHLALAAREVQDPRPRPHPGDLAQEPQLGVRERVQDPVAGLGDLVVAERHGGLEWRWGRAAVTCDDMPGRVVQRHAGLTRLSGVVHSPAMDLHVVGPAATAVERAAVDAFLDPLIGPAKGGWDGGERDIEVDGRVARGGHEARARRDLLLPTLHAIQDRIGWISQGALNHACRRLTVPPADAYGVASFYALLSTVPRPARVVHVCDDMACRLAGAERICADLERTLGPAGHPREGADATWMRSPCLGQCERAPAALFTIAGDPPVRFATGPQGASGILRGLEDPATADRSGLAGREDTRPSPERLAALRRFVPQAGDTGLRLLARVGRIDPTSLTDFRRQRRLPRAADGHRVGTRRTVIEEIITAEVQGRGGAAFPAGRKWAAVARGVRLPPSTSCATRTRPSRARSRTARSSRRTRSAWWRR